MNWAIVILHTDPARGGAERYTVDLANALAERGETVSLLAMRFGGGIAEAVRKVPIEGGALSRKRRYEKFIRSLEIELKNNRFDVVHAMLPVPRCDLYHPHAGLATVSVDSARGMKRVQNAMNPRRRAFADVERHLLAHQPPMLLCLSQKMRQNVIADGIVPADRAVVLFNAVDLARFDPIRYPHEPSNTLRALIVAQDFSRKGLATAISAIARVPRWTLTVVGGDDTRPYQRLCRTLGISDRVTFAGPLADVRPAYQQADLFILPTTHDPCSLVVLEALAMGVPVISTSANGACEIMSDGEHGFVINDAHDIEAFATAISNSTDPSRRQRMRSACLALRPRLSFQQHVERLIEIASSMK